MKSYTCSLADYKCNTKENQLPCQSLAHSQCVVRGKCASLKLVRQPDCAVGRVRYAHRGRLSGQTGGMGLPLSLPPLVDLVRLPPFVFIHLLPILLTVQHVPAAVHRPDSSPFVGFGPRILIRLAQHPQRSLTLLKAHASEVRKPR